jgi:lysophospholipase L1-like esterase
MRRRVSILSIALNIILLCGAVLTTYERGGVQYLTSLVRPSLKGDLYHLNKTNLYENTPIAPGSLVLLGDGILDLVAETRFPSGSIVNRAIAGDTTADVLVRLPSILEFRPSEIALLVGMADLQTGITVDVIERNFLAITAMAKAQSPNTKLLCLSLLPVNEAKYGAEVLTRTPTMTMPWKDDVESINDFLRNICPSFIQLNVLDTEGQLASDNTVDGLHLNGRGATALVKALLYHEGN